MSGCTLNSGRLLGQTGCRFCNFKVGRSCAATVSGVILLAAGMLGMSPGMAVSLTVSESLALEAGEHLLQPLPPVDSQGQRIQIALGKAPPGVLLTVDDFGQLLLQWQTGPDLAEESQIEILLSNVDTGKLLEKRQILVRRVEANVAPLASVKPERAIAAATDGVPSLGELPNQLVSPGFVVSLPVNATSSDASIPLLQVDRLPRRASFDVSEGGGRLFYWRTDTQDEGEHVFRFTAINPLDASLRSSREVMIVVGDPTRNRTRPAPEDTVIQQ